MYLRTVLNLVDLATGLQSTKFRSTVPTEATVLNLVPTVFEHRARTKFK